MLRSAIAAQNLDISRFHNPGTASSNPAPDVIRDLNREGMSILLVEQNARLALKLAHRGYVMETGSILMAEEAHRLLADPRVRSAYLGE